MSKSTEGSYISALGELRKRILGDKEQIELLEPLCRDICSIGDAEYTAVTTAALNITTEIFLELLDRYPKVMAGMAMVENSSDTTAHLESAREALSMTDREVKILEYITSFRKILYATAESSTSGKLCKAAIYNLFEILRAEALIEAHQDSSIILTQSTPWKATEDDAIGLFPLQSYTLFLRYLLRRNAPPVLNDNLKKTFLALLNDYTDICFFSFVAMDLVLTDYQNEVPTSESLSSIDISITALINMFQLLMEAAQEHIKKKAVNYYIEYIATSVTCIKGCARSASIPGVAGLMDVIVKPDVKAEQRRLPHGLLDRVQVLLSNMSSNLSVAEQNKAQQRKSQLSMRDHNMSQVKLLLAEAQRLEAENVAPPETEAVTPAYALEDAEGMRAVLFFCYYNVCELLFLIACGTASSSSSPSNFATIHNSIVAILTISGQVTQHATSSLQSIHLIETMKKFFSLQKTLERITGRKLPATHHAHKFSLAYKLMAIDSIFDLCTANNLPLKNLFSDLFALLVPEIFVISGCRHRILQLLAKCLRTSYVAGSIQACFLKRLAILSLQVSANVTLSILLLIIATLKRHSNLRWLLNNAAERDPADVTIFYQIPLSLSKCLELWEGTSVPNISLVELACLRNHYHPLIRKIVHRMEKGSILSSVKFYSKADADFEAVAKLDERVFIEQEFTKAMSSKEVSLFNAEGLVPNIKQHLIEGVDSLKTYPGFSLVEAVVRESWGGNLENATMTLATTRGGGVMMHSILQKTKTDVDFVSNIFLSDCWNWNSKPFPTHIMPHADAEDN